ncbi:MAG: DUF3237 domain-containing protein [Dehalococcoidia bacterium]
MEEAEIKTEFLFEVKIPQKPYHQIGKTPYGERMITTPASGATVRGPRLNGTVLEGGGDPFLIRSDGVGEIDARITIKADDGDLILMSYKGISVYTDPVQAALDRGEEVPPEDYYFYVAVLFETASERYRWLNETFAIARGLHPHEFAGQGIGYRVYAVV